jgi:hypothetical protein
MCACRSSLGTSPTLGSSCGSVPQALPAFHHPSHGLLRENHFTQQAYHKYHSRCLKGQCSSTPPAVALTGVHHGYPVLEGSRVRLRNLLIFSPFNELVDA